MENAIEIKKVVKEYRLYQRNVIDRFKDTFLPGRKSRHENFTALDGINIEVKQGEILGILGRNGAGKSTLLKVITGVTQQTFGDVSINGKVVALLELGGGFNPEYSGRENVYFTCSLQGMRKEEIDAKFDEIVEFSELGDFIDVPVKKYSSGMMARLGFATSIHINPDILILDEVLSVGDELFRRKCFMKMQEFFNSGKTILYVTHSAAEVIQMCNRAILLHRGQIVLDGHPELVVQQYHHFLSNVDNVDDEESLINGIRALDNNPEQKEELEKYFTDRDLKDRIEDSSGVISQGKKACLIPDFKTKSLDIYRKKNIEIHDYYLQTMAGEDVNHLIWGESYNLGFSATFHEEVTGCRLGIVIFNSKNEVISSSFNTAIMNAAEYITIGSKRTYKASFKAYLKDGLHAIQFLVHHGTPKGEEVVSAITDAIVFQCFPKGFENPGYVNLFLNDGE